MFIWKVVWKLFMSFHFQSHIVFIDIHIELAQCADTPLFITLLPSEKNTRKSFSAHPELLVQYIVINLLSFVFSFRVCFVLVTCLLDITGKKKINKFCSHSDPHCNSTSAAASRLQEGSVKLFCSPC